MAEKQNATVPSGDSMSMASSYSHSHLETDTTHSHDHLTGGTSRTQSPVPHSSEENDKSDTPKVQFPIPQNYIDNNNSSSQQQASIYMPPTGPLPSASYPMNKNDDHDMPPPPTYSEPPQYTPKNDADVVLEIGSSDRNISDIGEVKLSLQTDRSIRMAFIRKVYSLLTFQLFVTVVFTTFSMFYDPVKNFVNDHQWLFFLSWIASFITLILLFWQRKKSPLNLYLLLLFTLFMSYGIATLVSMYSSKVVLQAFLLTLGVFVALTLFTFQSKYDFSSWGPFLYAGLWIVIFALIIGWLFPYDRGYHIAISVICAVLFSAYIIYDTYMIIKKVSPEEYILATIDLYLDIINLFVAILAIIGGTSDQ